MVFMEEAYSGSVLWNSLPVEVQHLTSLHVFKGKYLKKLISTVKILNKQYAIFTRGLPVRQVFYYFRFYLRF